MSTVGRRHLQRPATTRDGQIATGSNSLAVASHVTVEDEHLWRGLIGLLKMAPTCRNPNHVGSVIPEFISRESRRLSKL